MSCDNCTRKGQGRRCGKVRKRWGLSVKRDTYRELALIAASLGMSVPRYVDQLVRAAIVRGPA